MNQHFTHSAVKAAHPLCLGYCELQDAFSLFIRAGWVTSQAYGWRYNVFVFGSLVVTTGYNAPGELATVPDHVRELAHNIRELYNDGRITLEEAQHKTVVDVFEYLYDINSDEYKALKED